MTKRLITFDTETTGFNIEDGNRVLEIGCVEIIDRRITGKTWHCYINPRRDSEEGALHVHGLTSQFLADKPFFEDVVDEFLDFIKGAELIAHNMAFDEKFINHELRLAGKRYGKLDDYCALTDTLLLAREKHGGGRLSLDALCSRYGVDNSNRNLHGALIDADLLAQVYLLLTGGQLGFDLAFEHQQGQNAGQTQIAARHFSLPVIYANDEQLHEHKKYLELLSKKSGKECYW